MLIGSPVPEYLGGAAVKSPVFPNLEILDNLTLFNAADIRPALVRELTYLYVQKPTHTSEEEHQYTELLLRLIDAVDIATRKLVAARLANYPAAPAEVVRRLAHDVLEVARPILEHSPRLTGSDLLAIIAERGPRYAAVIAHRLPIKTQAKPAAAADAFATAGNALALANPGAALTDPTAKIRAPARRESLPSGPTNLESASDPLLPRWAAVPGDVFRHLETAALERKPAEFMRILERALGISAERAHHIVTDQGGEPLLVAAKALGTPADMLLRVLVLLNPVIAESVVRVFDLAKVYDMLPREAALRLVASLRIARRNRQSAEPLGQTRRPLDAAGRGP